MRLVRELCEPLFMVFDFGKIDDDVYAKLVGDFLRGNIS